MANLNITNIPAPRVPFIDERTGLMAREWYRFFLNLFVLTGSGNNPITLEELQLGPPNQPDLTELLIQINQNIAPQYEDQSGDFLATLDTAQLMSMMSRFENAEAAIQGAYLQPVVQTGTIANYNLDGSPTAGGIAYGTGPALAVSAAGTVGQVLTSAGAGTPTWATPTTGTVTSVAALTLGTTGTDLSSTVANPTTTPVITLQVPTASAANRGALSSTDWSTFNSKGNGTVTSVSFTGGIITIANPTTTPALTVAGTSGGIPYFSNGTTWASSAALAAGALVLGGGAGVTPATTTTGTGVVTALGVNTGTAGAFVVNGGALGTPSSGTVTNLTGTASININGTVGATTANTGAFTTVTATGAVTAGGTALTLNARSSVAANAVFAYIASTGANRGLWIGTDSAGELWIKGFKASDNTADGYNMVLGSASGASNVSILGAMTQTPVAAATINARTVTGAASSNLVDWLVNTDATAGAGVQYRLKNNNADAAGLKLYSSTTATSNYEGASNTSLFSVAGTLDLITIANKSVKVWVNNTTQVADFSSGATALTGTLSATGIVTMSAYGAGAATFSAAGVISSVSDETWKVKDGAPVDPDAMLNKLQPGYWYYNDEKKEIFGTDRQLGFYAQNVNAAIGPEAAPKPEEGKPWGYYDRSVLAVTVMSLQKALATIELLTDRLEALETK
jgi:hypothetical protein